jgi:hypothetical protein
MTKLKIGSIEDDKPVSLTVKLPAMVYRDLTAYAEILKREGRQSTCRSNDACRANAGTIHGIGSCVQEAASWNSTKRFSKRRRKIRVRQLDCYSDKSPMR